MPSAHSLTQPRPAFQRLCTCERLLADSAHRSVNIFRLVLSERWFPPLLLLSASSQGSVFLVLLARPHIANGSAPLSYDSLSAGAICGSACASTLQPTFKQETHPEGTGLNTHSHRHYQKGHERRCVQSKRHVRDKGHST